MAVGRENSAARQKLSTERADKFAAPARPFIIGCCCNSPERADKFAAPARPSSFEGEGGTRSVTDEGADKFAAPARPSSFEGEGGTRSVTDEGAAPNQISSSRPVGPPS